MRQAARDRTAPAGTRRCRPAGPRSLFCQAFPGIPAHRIGAAGPRRRGYPEIPFAWFISYSRAAAAAGFCGIRRRRRRQRPRARSARFAALSLVCPGPPGRRPASVRPAAAGAGRPAAHRFPVSAD